MLERVNQGIMNRVKEMKSRDYLGASILGEECSKKLWHMFKFPKSVTDPKLQRIFDLGHILEDYVVKLFRDGGLEILTLDKDGEQFGFTDGIIAGHIDGVITNLEEPHLFECKSANDKSFKEYVKKGCKSNDKYWAQVHVYMKKMRLKKCLWVVINKNTCELHFETIELDEIVADHYLDRGHEIAMAETSPCRKYGKSTFYKCRWCDYNEECWDEPEES